MKNKILFLFKVPETIIAFISGALISAAINIFTSIDLISEWYNTVSAVLMIISSLILVVWTIIVKPIDAEFQEERKENKGRLVAFWAEKLLAHRGAIKILILCLVSFIVCLIGSIILLFTPYL